VHPTFRQPGQGKGVGTRGRVVRYYQCNRKGGKFSLLFLCFLGAFSCCTLQVLARTSLWAFRCHQGRNRNLYLSSESTLFMPVGFKIPLQCKRRLVFQNISWSSQHFSVFQ